MVGGERVCSPRGHPMLGVQRAEMALEAPGSQKCAGEGELSPG